MRKYKRVFIIVIDSLGIGAMPDAGKFGDEGADTLGHIAGQQGSAYPISAALGLPISAPSRGSPPMTAPLDTAWFWRRPATARTP